MIRPVDFISVSASTTAEAETNTKATKASTRQLFPFAALSASYFAHIGFFNPYLPLWLKDMGLGIFAISLLTVLHAAMNRVADLSKLAA